VRENGTDVFATTLYNPQYVSLTSEYSVCIVVGKIYIKYWH